MIIIIILVLVFYVKGISALKRQTQNRQYGVFKSTQFLHVQTASLHQGKKNDIIYSFL